MNRSWSTTAWKIVLVDSFNCSPPSISHSINILRICGKRGKVKTLIETYLNILWVDSHRAALHALRVSWSQNFRHWKAALETLIVIADGFNAGLHSRNHWYRLMICNPHLRDKDTAQPTVCYAFVANNVSVWTWLVFLFSAADLFRNCRRYITSCWLHHRMLGLSIDCLRRLLRQPRVFESNVNLSAFSFGLVAEFSH